MGGFLSDLFSSTSTTNQSQNTQATGASSGATTASSTPTFSCLAASTSSPDMSSSTSRRPAGMQTLSATVVELGSDEATARVAADLRFTEGQEDELIGRIQKRTGENREAVEKALKEIWSAGGF